MGRMSQRGFSRINTQFTQNQCKSQGRTVRAAGIHKIRVPFLIY